MTDKELVKALRKDWLGNIGQEAADRIEELSKERNDWIASAVKQQKIKKSAHASGLREGLEMAAKWHEDKAALDMEESKRCKTIEFGTAWRERAGLHLRDAAAIRALSPATQAKEQKE